MTFDLAIIGQGRVGTALGAALAGTDVAVTSLSSRSLPTELAASAYVVAVRDADVAATARRLVSRHQGGAPIILHTAGALSSSVLLDAGAAHGALMHPLVAFAGATATLRGAWFAIEGDAMARELATTLVAKMGGQSFFLRADQLATYHAAAVLASNHVLGLVAVASALLAELGLEERAATTALARLFRGVADNLDALGLPRALTGPIARGDAETVRAHLVALAEEPEARASYLATAPVLVRLAAEKGSADPVGLQEIRRALSESLRLYPIPGVD